MIKFSVLYPCGENNKFDMKYYCEKHFPLCKELMGDALKKAEVNEGISGIEPDSKPLYAVMGHLYFNSVEEFRAAFTPIADKLYGDVPNFTDIPPVILINQVNLSW